MNVKLSASSLIELSEILLAGYFPKKVAVNQAHQDSSLSWS